MNGLNCGEMSTGTFRATRIRSLTGTYAGSLTLTQASAAGVLTKTPVTMQFDLQQGATLVGSGTGTGVSSELALAGVLRVQGTTCFSSGKTSVTLPSLVEGSEVLANFDMDDGSVLQMTGVLGDMNGSQISVSFVQMSAGRCGVLSGIPPTVFARQL